MQKQSARQWPVLFLFVVLLALFLAACGATSNSYSSNPPQVPQAMPAVVTITPSPLNAAPGGAPVTLNISVTNDQPTDKLSPTVSSDPACGGPCGSFGTIQGAAGGGSYSVMYTPPASIQQTTSQTITISSNLPGSSPGSTTVNLTAPALVVSITPNPIDAAAGGSPVTLNISVANDVSSDSLTATVSSSAACGGGPCGSLGAISGTAGSGSYTVAYTPPASIQQKTSQTITVSSSVLGSTAGTATLNLTSGGFLCPSQGSETIMTGTWVFLAQGFEGTNPMAIGATFTADGSAGLISAGTMDINVAGSAPQTNLAVNPSGSTYSVDSKGRACIGLATPAGTKVFHAALASYGFGNHATEGQIEEFDDTAGNGGRALGLLKQQQTPPKPWDQSALSGLYVFGLNGWNAAGGHVSHVSAAGNITFDGTGVLKNGLGDANDAGVLTTAQTIPTGTYTLAADGRGTISFAVGSATVDGAVYVADSSDLFLLSTSPASASAPLVAGRAIAVVANAALVDANGVSGYQLVTLAGANDATIGVVYLSPPGPGTPKTANITGTLWRDVGGSASSQAISGATATFKITDSAHGRVTFSIPGWTNPPVAYFTGFSKLASLGNQSVPTTAFLVGTGSDAEAGEVIWQSFALPNFNAASLKYSAASAELQSSGNNSSSQTSSVGQVTLDGAGGYAEVIDTSSPSAGNPLATSVSGTGAYTVNADGSGTFTPAGAANGPWPMVTNGVKSYHIVEPSGNTAPVVSVITKQ